MLAQGGARAEDTLRVGSKRFTESYILAEILAQTAARHAKVEHRPGMGNTAILFEALKAGAIDVYPEYAGTIDLEILKHAAPTSLAQMNRELAPLGLGVAVRLGFNNTYALAMRKADSQAPPLQRLSAMAARPELRLGLSHEFLGRADGWPGLAQRYGLPQKPTGLDHGIAYEALASGQVDVIDIYSTDAKIAKYRLQVLDDDLHYFPSYDAVLLYRLDLPQRFPEAWQAMLQLAGRISATEMIALNADAELEGQSFSRVAQNYLSKMQAGQSPRAGFWDKLLGDDLWRLTWQHLLLVVVSVTAAALLGIPLGIIANYQPWLRQGVMAVVGVMQTIPALALLAMLIPLLGSIGTTPALIALFLYALLPIVRNTSAGLAQVPAGLGMAGKALGLQPLDCLWLIELPLALPVILAGLKTAAVMSVGTATIAAFVGAGGYGERIASGLALNDQDMLLAGAIPAAVLALATQLAFEALEWGVQRRRSGSRA